MVLPLALILLLVVAARGQQSATDGSSSNAILNALRSGNGGQLAIAVNSAASEELLAPLAIAIQQGAGV